MPSEKPFIRTEGLCRYYKVGNEKIIALDDVNLEVERGKICCVLGTSGSGKSTLLNMLAGLERPTAGAVYIGKYRIDKFTEHELAQFRQRFTGFVFQSYNLISTLTAEENVALPLVFKGTDKEERIKRAREMLRLVGLENRMRHRPNEMSGGQQQRVGIARAFVGEPKVIFADEPTGNLDSKTTSEVMRLITELVHKNNQTMILVTHDENVAEYADVIVKISDGRIVETGTRQKPDISEEKGEEI